ncbi:TPA: YcaO-like family protein [Streptococcus suis]|nr:YcaO-like family protein [Streptococcus suis]
MLNNLGCTFYTIKDNKFLNSFSPTPMLMLSSDYNHTFASSVHKEYRKSVVGAIGESFERHSMFMYTSAWLSSIIECFDLYEKKIVTLENDSNLQKFFNDSCGMASHTNSRECFLNAFDEFIERQSFILTYLSKSPRRVIKKNKSFLDRIPSRFHHLNFYEISIIDSYKVYFAIGYKNNYLDIGLGSSYDATGALEKLIRELSLPNIEHGSLEWSNNTYQDYLHIFHMISPDRILQAYNFLNLGEEIEFRTIEKVGFDIILEELNKKYKMRPKALSLFNKNYDYSISSYSKNIKIFDENWFPSLSVSQFTDSIYDRVELLSGMKLDRNINFIPFP